MVMKRQRGKNVEVQDGWAGRILPFELVQRELLVDEAAKVAAMEERLPASIATAYPIHMNTMRFSWSAGSG